LPSAGFPLTLRIAGAPRIREAGQEEKTPGDGVDEAGGGFHAAALLCDMEPDIVKVGFGPWRYTVSH
jgi:hypothetical protein